MVPPLAAEAWAARHRAARGPWQMPWLMAAGHSVQEVVAVTASAPRWITRRVWRFSARGPAAGYDRRNRGRRSAGGP